MMSWSNFDRTLHGPVLKDDQDVGGRMSVSEMYLDPLPTVASVSPQISFFRTASCHQQPSS